MGWLIASADLDGDGLGDAVVVDNNLRRVTVMLANGDGTLTESDRATLPGPHAPTDLDLADADGDGLLDVAVAMGEGDRVALMLGRPDGTLADPEYYVGGDVVLGVALADATGDGRIDLIASYEFDDAFGVLANLGVACRADLDGDGELTIFDFLAFQNAFDAGDPIADFDGDGAFTIFDFLAFQNEFDLGCV
jgi:hypothetical protein